MAAYLKHIELEDFIIDGDIPTSMFTPIVTIVELIDTDGNAFPVTEYD